MTELFILFGCWILGIAILYLWLWNKNRDLRVQDVLITFILSAAIGLVFSFAGYKANISHWVVWLAFAGLAGLITYKLLDQRTKGV